MILKKATRALLDAIYPPVCILCGELSQDTHPHCCGLCLRSFEPVGASCCIRCGEPFPVRQEPHLCLSCLVSPVPFRWCRGLYLYRGAVAGALSGLKYGKSLALAGPLAEALERGVDTLEPIPVADVVVPVPASRRVLLSRGFNCAAILAKPLARRLGVALAENVVVKCGSIPQVGLGRSARLENAARSFAAGSGIGKVKGKRVMLFDDVYTTGATAKACARLLVRAGALVSVLTLARRAPENLEHLFVDASVGSQDP
ncbi:MAG: double zinc ribbon domain-containing protein [bacterium]|nr:double zinc ribbon domain-containing protein [bacterium]